SRPIVIPNWGDIDQIRPSPRHDNALLRELGIDSKFVVQVMGNIGRTHAIEGVLDAAELLADNSDVHFLIVSAGARAGWLRAQIAERKLGNVSWLPPCPPDALNLYLNACDVAAVPLRAGMTGVSMPSRLYNIFASGRPTLAIAEPETELAMTVTEHDVGWVVPPNDATAIAAAIRAAAAEPAAVATMGRRARELAVSSFSRERAGAAYRMLCGQLSADACGR